MAQRTQAILLLGFAALSALFLLFATPLRAADPTPIACPSGQTTFVQGRASAGEALLLFFNSRAVGGGLSDASGAYRLPLRVQDRPGTYPVEVRLRSNRAVVERFTCFVNIPLDSTAVPSPTAGPTSPSRPTPAPAVPAPTRAVSPTPGPPPGIGQSTPTLSSTATATSTATVTPTGPTATPTVTPTGPTATPTRTSGPSTPSPTSTVTNTPVPSDVTITDVALFDPAFQNSVEYVRIEMRVGAKAIDISGWRLVNSSRPDATRPQVPAFIFPTYTINSGATIAVYSESGQTNLEDGDFFWNQPSTVWKRGDRAELRDATGNLISSWIVTD